MRCVNRAFLFPPSEPPRPLSSLPQSHLNQEQLIKVLTDLLGLYQTARALGVETPNSAEFKSYIVLMNYGGVINKQVGY